MKGIHIFLVEKSPLFRSALISILHRFGFSVTPTDPANLEARPGKEPDAVLVDIATFPIESPGMLDQLIVGYSRIAPVLLLARDDRVDQLVSGLKAGAVGFVKQTASPKDLRRAIVAVAGGRIWCDPQLFQRIMKCLPRLPYSEQPRLTGREAEVLKYVSLGQTNKEIARCLGLSEQSVKVYVSNLFRKTGATNRSSLALHAVTWGLADLLPEN